MRGFWRISDDGREDTRHPHPEARQSRIREAAKSQLGVEKEEPPFEAALGFALCLLAQIDVATPCSPLLIHP
jgi:hypothetical protein